MQSKTRYVNISIGIGGWQPMPADFVRKKGYGDCKALTNYMRVLLKAVGIPSYYSIIYSDKTPQLFDKDFPKIGGNHVILCVPTENGNIWLENTSQKIAFNHVAYTTLDRNVVMIKDDLVELADTPKSSFEKNKEITRVKAKLLENNSVEVTSNFVYEGSAYDMLMSLLSLTPTEQKEALRNLYDNIIFSSLEIQNMTNDRDHARLSFDFNFKADNYAKSLGNEIYFRAIPFANSSFYLDDKEERVYQ